MKRVHINGTVHPDLAKKLDAYRKVHNCSKSSVIEAALKEYFSDNSDSTLIMKDMARHRRALDRISRDMDIFTEAFAAFVKIYMAHTPRIPDEQKEMAKHSAEGRYHDFMEFVAKQVSLGHRFVDDLVQDSPADDEELKQYAEV